MKKLGFAVLSFLVLPAFTFAQKAQVSAESLFPGDEVRGVKVPVPKYPDAVRKAGIGGTVAVPVTVAPDGSLSAIGEPSGPYPVCPAVKDGKILLLRQKATEAARKTKFTNSSARPIEGRLNYTFQREEPKGNGGSYRVVGEYAKAEPERSDTGAKVYMGEATTADSDDRVSGGLLNGKAASLTRPPYPPAARAVRASGTVQVQVLISEDGTMFSAEAISGHPLLRANAEKAACSSRFMPTLLSGQPVKISGIITYNFVP